ncbi:MAG: hypothetical protein ABJA66_20905 [Actinomycetota bacterium]
MKLKFLLAMMAIFTFASIAFTQSITITPKKTVYTRKGKVTFKEKRTFTVIYPIVAGTISAPVKKKLANTISYWRIFETTLQENLSESDWLSEASYKVNYNKNGILDISLSQEGSAAYPDSQTFNLVINLKTGEQVKLADAFKTNSLAEFAQMVDKKLKVETATIIKSIDKGEFGNDDKESNESLKEQLKGLEFTAESFNEYEVNDKGVTILYDAGFPHVIQAAQPDGRYFFTWAEIKRFVRADGLLGKFIR